MVAVKSSHFTAATNNGLERTTHSTTLSPPFKRRAYIERRCVLPHIVVFFVFVVGLLAIEL